MNKSQKRFDTFARNWVIDRNATRSAIAAGYSESTAGSKGSQLLKKSNVRRLIEKYDARANDRTDISADKIRLELSRTSFANMMDYIDPGTHEIDLARLTRDQAAAIQEVRVDMTGGVGDGERKLVPRVTLRLYDKHKGLELLGRSQPGGSIFADKMQHSGLESVAEAIAKGRKALEE